MYAKELKLANGRKPGKDKDVSTPHCIYDNDPFRVGQVEDKDMLYKMSIELPETYNPPPIDDCVNDFGIPKSAELMKAVNSAADHIVKDSASAGLNRENVKSLNLYSFDYKPPSKGLFGGKDSKDENEDNTVRKRVNDMLKERNPFNVVKARGYLVSFLTSLRKLPHVEKFAFYCGVKEKLTNATKFKYGSLLSCKHFLSCSTDPDSIKEMLNYTGTLFIIRGDPWAYDIRPFSFYPNEQEYIFEFGSQFKVTKVINGPINTIEMALNRVQNYDLTKLVPIPGYTYESPDASKPSQQTQPKAKQQPAQVSSPQVKPAQPSPPQLSSPQVEPAQPQPQAQPPQVKTQQQVPPPMQMQPQPQQPQQQQVPQVQTQVQMAPQQQQASQIPPPMQMQPQQQVPQVQTQVQMTPQQQQQQYQQYQMQQQYSQQQYQMQQQYSQQQYQASPQQNTQGQKSYQQYLQQQQQRQQQQYLGYVQNVVPHGPSNPNPPNVYASAALGAFAVNAARTFSNPPNRAQPQPQVVAPVTVPPRTAVPQVPAPTAVPQRQRPLAPAISTACIQHQCPPPVPNRSSIPGQYPQAQNSSRMQVRVPGNTQQQNNLVASKSVFQIQPKLVSRASLNIKRDGTISARIAEAAAKIRDPSLRFYLEGCDELSTIIYENNNRSTKEMCMQIKIVDSIFATLVSNINVKDICLASFNIIALLSDEAATDIIELECIETLASVTEIHENDPNICGLWCGIVLNLFKNSPSFHDLMLDPSKGTEGFETLKYIYKTHNKDHQVCDAIGQIILEFFNDGYFIESRKALAGELLGIMLQSLSADATLSHSLCPAMAELLTFLGTGLDVNGYALLVAVVNAQAGFLDDLLPALTVLMRVSEMKEPNIISHASELGISRVVVTMLHNYAEDSAVVEVCLALASNVLTSNISLCDEFVQLRFVELAISSIRKHGASVPSICTYGLDALLVMSMNASAIQSFISSNGTPLLFEIMRSPIASELIMRNVWGICSWVAKRNGSIVLAGAGGGEVILGLFETYVRDQVSAERGSVTLMYLVQSCPEMSSIITTPQAISLFANALGMYMDNQSICAQISFLFSKIVDILDGSGIENCVYQLLSVVFKHGENKTIVECVCATLKRVILSDIAHSRPTSTLSGSNWGSNLGGVLEKNFNSLDICRSVIDALETLTRIQDPANFRSLLAYIRTFVIIFGNYRSDLTIVQCASGVLKNIIMSENALQMLAGTTETIPAIKAVLEASGQDKIVFLNCSYVLSVLVENVPQLYQMFVQDGCATIYYNLYAMFKTTDPATASEGSWIEKHISH